VQKATLLVESILILVRLSIVLWERCQRSLKRWWKARRAKPKRRWTMQPRTPDDCQDCRSAAAEAGPGHSQVRRWWGEEKSRRGRPKTHDSSGQACKNPRGEYDKDTDPDVHALRRDGQRNVSEAPNNGNVGRVGVSTPHDWAHRCTG
jgi:hypothetical protein